MQWDAVAYTMDAFFLLLLCVLPHLSLASNLSPGMQLREFSPLLTTALLATLARDWCAPASALGPRPLWDSWPPPHPPGNSPQPPGNVAACAQSPLRGLNLHQQLPQTLRAPLLCCRYVRHRHLLTVALMCNLLLW